MSEQRIPVSHVGSLVRPSEFAALLEERVAGRPVANFDAALRSAVEQVVRRQVQAGVDIVSDGEFGKGIGWEQYVLERLSGFSEEPPGDPSTAEPPIPRWGDFARFADFYRAVWDRERYLEHPMPCTGPIRYTGHAALQRDISNLKAAAAGAGAQAAFLPVVAPASATALSENRYYASDEAYIYAVAEALRVEYQTVLEGGFSCRSTMLICRSCTTGWSHRARTRTMTAGRGCGSMHSITRYADSMRAACAITSAGAAGTALTRATSR